MSDKSAQEILLSTLVRHHRAGLLTAVGILSAFGVFNRFGLYSVPGMAWLLGWGLAVGSLIVVVYKVRGLSIHLQTELALALVLLVQGLTQATGGIGSPWMLGYVFILLLTAFSFGIRINLVALGSIFVLETIPLLQAEPPLRVSISTILVWYAGLFLIPLVVKGYIRAWIKEKVQLRETVSRMKTSARTILPSPDIREKQQVHSMDNQERLRRLMPLSQRFEDIVDNLLWILKTSLRSSNRCVLFLIERPDLTKMRLYHVVGSDPQRVEGSFELTVGEGLMGWIAKGLMPVRLGHLEESRDEAVEYLKGHEKIQSLLAMPLVSEGILEGMVVADSAEKEAFSEEDESTLVLVCREILRAMHDLRDRERVHTKAIEFSTLLEVSRALSSKLDLGHRLETMADKVGQIIAYDHCFIFLVHEGERRADLAVVRGYDRPKLEGGSVALGDGFISLIVKNRRGLLFRDLHERKRRHPLFPSGCRITLSPASFLGLPLIVDDRVIGVFAIASQRPNAFDGHHMDFLETLCHQAALSVSDAQLHHQLERLATSDGLTGVLNHRKFQEKLAEEFERQNRQPVGFSLIMLDVDHFKRINDSFGHPVGDQVLKQLAGILAKMVRKVDTLARYGGEEFSLLLPNAGKQEALRLAERIRKAIEDGRFESGTIRLSVTVSMGVATFPDDTRLRSDLLEYADQALYAAKKAGRNRVCAFDTVKS